MELTTEEQKICIQCQECCHWMTFTLLINDPALWMKYREFYQARGCKIKTTNSQMTIMINKKCPHLTANGCDCYETRPQACREYDGRQDLFLKERCKLPQWR